MVSKFVSGESINGALGYNEKKVQEGKAELLHAEGYGLEKEQLSFENKYARLHNLTLLRPSVKVNCVHVSLNFDPKESISNERLKDIAQTYLDKIGFGEQPYLLYRHYDAAHPHVHLLTTNITSEGKRIALHNLAKKESERARKEIEKMFGLVPAQGREKEPGETLKPVPEKVVYGKSETKAAVSNVVRSVVKEYRYTSLAELNAVLKQFNIEAYRGGAGTRMYEKRGLVYSVLDGKGNKIGVPIKASSIYTGPTLNKLEKNFDNNKTIRLPYKDRLKNIIERTLDGHFLKDKEAFAAALRQQNIGVVFRQNDKMVYGITYIDHVTKCVFNGSGLGKSFTASAVMQQIGKEGIANRQERQQNKKSLDDALRGIAFDKGIAGTLAQLYQKGFRINTENESGRARYTIGQRHTQEDNYTPVHERLAAYFEVNKVTASVCDMLNNGISMLTNPLAGLIQNVLSAEPPAVNAPQDISDKKKKRHRPNW